MQKRGLGRGLEALIPSAMGDGDASKEVALDEIVPNPYQPRQAFDEQKLAELTDSIREHGILQPVLLRRIGIERYELIAGERRVRAARLAGLSRIPAIVREFEDVKRLEVALIENIQREDINPVEAAQAYGRLRGEFGLTQEQIAQRVGKSQPAVANALRLLSLPKSVLESLNRGEITEGHARAILQAPGDSRETVCQTVLRRRLSVRETERLARNIGQPAKEREPSTADPNLAAVEEQLQESLATKVRIHAGRGESGRIEIEFYTLEHLESLFDRLRKQ